MTAVLEVSASSKTISFVDASGEVDMDPASSVERAWLSPRPPEQVVL